MKKAKKLMILLLAVVMVVSVVMTGGFALTLPETSAPARAGDDAKLMAITPGGTTTVDVPVLRVTQVNGGNVNVRGQGGAVSLEGSGGTAYLYGNFASLNSTPAVSIGAGWTVYIGNTSDTSTSIAALTYTDSEIYGVKISGASTVNLESGAISASNHNRSSARAYGVYAENGATVNLGTAATAEAYSTGASVTTYGASGNYGLTATSGCTLNLYHGDVFSQEVGATAVSVYNSSVTVRGGGVMGTQTNAVLQIRTDNQNGDTAMTVSGTSGSWNISGVGVLFSGYTALNASIVSGTNGGGLTGGTFIGNGGPAISTSGVIQDELRQNYYLRNDAGYDYYRFSDGTRQVSAGGHTASGTLTVTDAEAELSNTLSASGSGITNYSLPCNVTLTAGGVIAYGTKTLNINGKNLEYDGSDTGYVVDVPASQRLTILDRSAWQYTNISTTSGVTPAGVIRRADTGCAVKVETSGVLTLGSQSSYGPMITGYSASTSSTVTGLSSAGSVVMYSGSIYGSYIGAETNTGIFDIAAGSKNQEFSVISGKLRYGLAQYGGTLNIRGGVISLDAASSAVGGTSAAYPWALYMKYGSNRTQGVAGVTNITGGCFYSVATDAMVSGRNQQLADLMTSDLSFTDNQTVNLNTGLVTKPTRYKVASPTVMRGSENATSKGDYDNYLYYGYAIYNGMADSTSYDYSTSTGLHVVSTRAFTSYFTVGSNKDYPASAAPSSGKTPNKDQTDTVNKDVSLITDDHFAFISGYPNGTFRPAGTLTRAEASVIFYKLLQNKNYISSKYFSDVNHNDWYYTYVSCLAAKGIISGYPDGRFHPDWKVTRAEFCVMAAKFYSLKSGTIHFSDVPDTYWAYKYIASAAAYGWIDDSYGNYYPNNAMPRQEVVVFVNRMTGRIPDEYFINNSTGTLKSFSDVPRGSAYYYQIMEASNGHTYVQKNGVETWQKLAG